ncbi:SDR family NAD(P)-dependent oxidoreductase [Candidatus Spongiihabitans sp.]|uniref:SDR family NAD(P)-dependent oxidoreductase n=1 Tax=Candidatus Spongiihabitans sp. TaxID=3101308 RepID=UPI003C7BBF88
MNDANLAAPATWFSLSGKHAVVTGGGSGIGFTIAETLAAAGATVTVVGRRAARLQEAADKIVAGIEHKTENKNAVQIYPCDLGDIDGIDAHADQLARTHGAVDILVNAAGWRTRQPAADITPKVWRATIDINLSAPFFLARALAPAMCERGWGRVLNIASLQSRLAFENGIAYGASKGGIAQLTRAMATEWSAHGVNANAIAPGFFPTEMTAPLFGDDKTATALAARTAIGRNGKLDDLKGAALFFCAPASDYLTGQILYVDGGFTAK